MNRDLGAFVAVDNLYSALIPKREMYGRMYPGQEIEARVAAVKEDGKLDLSVRGKIPEQMDKDAELILECIETCGVNFHSQIKQIRSALKQRWE